LPIYRSTELVKIDLRTSFQYTEKKSYNRKYKGTI
jgi:hypothetical protein